MPSAAPRSGGPEAGGRKPERAASQSRPGTGRRAQRSRVPQANPQANRPLGAGGARPPALAPPPLPPLPSGPRRRGSSRAAKRPGRAGSRRKDARALGGYEVIKGKEPAAGGSGRFSCSRRCCLGLWRGVLWRAAGAGRSDRAAHLAPRACLPAQSPLPASATRRPNMAQEVSEYLSQNPRVAAWVEALRCDGETDKHWRHRREFLLRNAGDLAPAGGAASAPREEAADAESGTRNRQLQQLISFSMAWANHVFLGCRYPQKVMDKILSMAEGIKVTDAPIHITRDELVAKVKKRGISSSNEGVEEPAKKRAIEGKNNSAVEQDRLKIPAKTSGQQESSSTCSGSSSKSQSSGNSALSSSNPSQNSSATSDGERAVASQSSSSTASQVTAVGSGKASEPEVPDKHGSASFVSSLLKSSVNSHVTQSTDSRQQSGSPKKSALEGSSTSASQSVSEIEVPLLGSSGSSEVELPLLSSKPSSETASSGLTSKASSEASVSSLVSKNSSSSGTSSLTPKSNTSVNTMLTSKSASQVAASLLASKNSSQTSGSLVSKNTAIASVSQLASKSSSQTSTAQLPSKSTSQSSESSVKFSCCKLTNEDVKQKQPFFNRLYKTVAWKLVAVGGFSPNVNHGELLNAAIEALKATLDVFFVPLKELADLPQNKSSQESIVCELRCKSVYLGTGCGKSKENAKAVASREALKLFLKKKVVVKICKRKYRGSEIEDLVLLDEESRPVNLPPALKHPQELL